MRPFDLAAPAVTAFMFLQLGCAAAPQASAGTGVGGAPGAPTPASGQQGETAPLPPGYGTLRQDEMTMSLRDGPLLIKVTPLRESLIRLLAPDTYGRLHRLVERIAPDAAVELAGAPALFLVSFFSYEPNVAFRPEDVRLLYQGRPFDAMRVTPLSDGFDRRLLSQQVSQSAIYAFDARIDYEQPFQMRYGTRDSDDWSTLLPRLDVERARIRSRIGGGEG